MHQPLQAYGIHALRTDSASMHQGSVVSEEDHPAERMLDVGAARCFGSETLPGQSSTCTARAAHPMGAPFLSSMCSEPLHAVSTSPSVADVWMSGPKWNRYRQFIFFTTPHSSFFTPPHGSFFTTLTVQFLPALTVHFSPPLTVCDTPYFTVHFLPPLTGFRHVRAVPTRALARVATQEWSP